MYALSTIIFLAVLVLLLLVNAAPDKQDARADKKQASRF